MRKQRLRWAGNLSKVTKLPRGRARIWIWLQRHSFLSWKKRVTFVWLDMGAVTFWAGWSQVTFLSTSVVLTIISPLAEEPRTAVGMAVGGPVWSPSSLCEIVRVEAPYPGRAKICLLFRQGHSISRQPLSWNWRWSLKGKATALLSLTS
jgi:hypothetical protein